MRKFKMGIRRFGASLSALLMICCMTAPALAASGDTVVMPSSDDFRSHPFSWYVWKDHSDFVELISCPMNFGNDGYLISADTAGAYDLSYQEKEFVSGDLKRTFAFPTLYELSGSCGSWRYYPSFSIGRSYNKYAHVCIYPSVSSNFPASSIEAHDYVGAVCPSPSYFSLDFSLSLPSDRYFSLPMLPTNQLLYPVAYGPWKSGNSYGNQWYTLPGLDDSFLSTESSVSFVSPTNTPILGNNVFWDGSSDWKLASHHFAEDYAFPSSEACFWLSSKSNPILGISGIVFAPSLWVPKFMLPSDVQVGDWISHGTMDKLQDQLVNDFDVNSDTLKDSKQNLDTWRDAETIDSDVADTVISIMDGLFQGSLSDFVVVVFLLCFGAVIIRVLIRKAVEG